MFLGCLPSMFGQGKVTGTQSLIILEDLIKTIVSFTVLNMAISGYQKNFHGQTD